MEQRESMDFMFVGMVATIFAVAAGLVFACERLGARS